MKQDTTTLLRNTNSGSYSDDEEYAALMDGKGAAAARSTKQRRTKLSVEESATASSTNTTTSNSSKKDRLHPNTSNPFVKYGVLGLLVLQTVGMVLLMRYSRTSQSPDQPLYLASTAVFFMEVIKLVVCLTITAGQAAPSGSSLSKELYHHVLQAPMEMLKLTVPSLLYTIQNNLLYLALTNLDAATYQVCYQLKILTTALFSAVLLNRKFSRQKWFALVVLTVGVAIVQVSGSGDQHSEPNKHDGDQDTVSNNVAADAENNSHNRMIGLLAVLCAACTSGFSGVYFERILKGSRTSLWIRNVQMGLPSVVMAYITVWVKDGATIQTQGWFGGYRPLVWTVVCFQATGGLIVATVVKYADNVLKVFAMSFSIVLSCIVSAFLFDFHPSLSFLVGASLVVTATVMYSSPEKPPSRGAMRHKGKPLLPTTTGGGSSSGGVPKR